MRQCRGQWRTADRSEMCGHAGHLCCVAMRLVSVVKLSVCLQAVSLPSLPAVLVFKDGTYYTYNGETDTEETPPPPPMLADGNQTLKS